jgi:CHASE2 domain-containing sensor protein
MWTGSPTSVLSILRLEGLAVAAISAILYARTGASWWLFAALWLAPDLSMLGYLGRPCRAARIYNAAHTYFVPITLAVCALLLKAQALVPIALIWVNHIGVDRMLGYGLKYQTGFGWTHLGKLGKEAR